MTRPGEAVGTPGASIRLFLCGDVMTGRGIDQVLPHPSDPRLFEPYVRDARHYVALAEEVNGEIPRPVDLEAREADVEKTGQKILV